MELVKAGVVGLGILGTQHAEFLAAQQEVELVGVADVRGKRLEDVAGRLTTERYSDYDRMFAEQKLDVVAVATPDSFHKGPVLSAIKAGVRAIILEKPMATTVADANEMFEAAQKSGSKIFINFANRGSPLDLACYYVIKKELLGKIVYGEVHLDDNILVPTSMWGDRTREWTGGSSTAHFLLSHVVDFLLWVFSPAEVTQVYAISQNQVLQYTPDLYDAFLTFTNGAKVRVKAEWIRYIDGLVEFGFSFSGASGTMVYIKKAGFGERDGWRANVSQNVTQEQLLAHQDELRKLGANVRALAHRPKAVSGALTAGNSELKLGLESFDLELDSWKVARGFVDAVLEDTLEPSSWQARGPLPSAVDGLRQTRVVCGVVESAASGRVVDLSS